MNLMTPELRVLCNRLATERTRTATWTEAAALRRSLKARLQAGEAAEALADELRAEIASCAGGARARLEKTP